MALHVSARGGSRRSQQGLRAARRGGTKAPSFAVLAQRQKTQRSRINRPGLADAAARPCGSAPASLTLSPSTKHPTTALKGESVTALTSREASTLIDDLRAL